MFSGYRIPQSRDIAPIVTFQIDRGLKMWHWGNLLVSLVLLKLWFSGSGEPVVCMLLFRSEGDCADSGFCLRAFTPER